MAAEPEALCFQCEHYFVTWDKRASHGCRSLRFKSPELPCVVVFTHSDLPCGSFEKRKRHHRRRANNGSNRPRQAEPDNRPPRRPGGIDVTR